MTAMISDSSPGARGQVPSQVRSVGDEVMRGGNTERQVIRGLLRRAQRGLGGVVLVEGEPGIGKSLLLREATDEAAREGFSLAAGVADQLGRAIPFFALRTAWACRLPRPPQTAVVVICRMRPRGGSARRKRTWNSGLKQIRSWCAWMTCSGQAQRPWRHCGHCPGS